jgi:hypothetical protein
MKSIIHSSVTVASSYLHGCGEYEGGYGTIFPDTLQVVGDLLACHTCIVGLDEGFSEDRLSCRDMGFTDEAVPGIEVGCHGIRRRLVD